MSDKLSWPIIYLFVATVSHDSNIKYIKFTPLAQTFGKDRGHEGKTVPWWIRGKVYKIAKGEVLLCIN